jgi:hypothetical protein
MKKIIISSVLLTASLLSADSISVVSGVNLTDSGSSLDDSGLVGLQYSRDIKNHEGYSINIGYDYLPNVDVTKYSDSKNSRMLDNNGCEINPCKVDPCINNQNSSDVINGDQDNGNVTSNDQDNGNVTSNDQDNGNVTSNDHDSVDVTSNDQDSSDIAKPSTNLDNKLASKNNNTRSRETDLHRVYVNGVKNINLNNKLNGSLLAGVGYEFVENEYFDVEDQPFVNIGAGLSYEVNDKIDLVSQAKMLYKIDNYDFDTIIDVGLSFKF